MFSIRFNRWTIAAFAVAALAVPGSLSAQTPDHPADNSAQFPSQPRSEVADHVGQLSGRPPRQRGARRRLGGGVLSLGAAHRSEEQRAARSRLHLLARRWRYRRGGQARRPHPDDRQVQSRGAAGGRRARPEAEEICAPRSSTSTSRSAGRSPTWWRRCCRAGPAYGAGDTKAAVASIDKLTGPEWYPIFKDLHAGMILELAGKEKDAGVRLERAYKLDDSMLRVAETTRAGCRATRTTRRRPRSTRRSTRSCRGIRWCRKGCAKPRPARRCRRWSIRRRPARPKRCTASAPR